MPRYSIFGQISARDVDSNDQLTYSLSPNPYVTINKHTGHLRLKHHLHRLIDQILNVTVHVSDGIHRNQTSIQIYVHAFPDAQEPILLPEPAFALTVNESIAVGTVISNIYRRFQLMPLTIDLIEIVHDDQRKLPFSIDQQGKRKRMNRIVEVLFLQSKDRIDQSNPFDDNNNYRFDSFFSYHFLIYSSSSSREKRKRSMS